jgi:hypothetical protein
MTANIPIGQQEILKDLLEIGDSTSCVDCGIN